MFTGIIEGVGEVKSITKYKDNLNFTIHWDKASELKIDQSLAHQGVCLTVVNIDVKNNFYEVQAIDETLQKSNLKNWKVGDFVNLERCLSYNGRMDGHLVQGHVDTVAKCTFFEEKNGSWLFSFTFDTSFEHLIVEKGSICINGVSLTVVDSVRNTFSVAIIPYTYENTTFKNIQIGDDINLEFDIIGKYLQKQLKAWK